MTNIIIQGDVLQVLSTLPDASVDCVITSPPYWGLRDYGTATWEGGDPMCNHAEAKEKSRYDYSLTHSPIQNVNNNRTGTDAPHWKNKCPKCGAIKKDNQIGLEQTPEEYVAKLVAVFREVRRVLKDDGTLWLNLGDSYAGSGKGGQSEEKKSENWQPEYAMHGNTPQGLKPKDLVGIPWRVAFALQADGWYLRQDIIWAKPNPMPESVTDRCTKSHEYVFLLAKSQRYYFDNEAIKEQAVWDVDGLGTDERSYRAEEGHKSMPNNLINGIRPKKKGPQTFGGKKAREGQINGGDPRNDYRSEKNSQWGKVWDNQTNKRNKRDVWTITTKPFKDAHFATFPEDLIVPMVKAGTSEKGVCPDCGKAWERKMERISNGRRYSTGKSKDKNEKGLITGFSGYDDGTSVPVYKTLGWKPTCSHTSDPVPAIVFDPFMGSGTTAAVARRLGRNYLGIELNPAYIRMAEKRLAQQMLL